MKKRRIIFLFLILLSGCMVGPDYEQPQPLMPGLYSEEQEGKTCVIADKDLIRWWKILDDPFLNELMEETLQANFDLFIALEMVYQARAAYEIQVSNLFPEIDFTGFIRRSRLSQTVVSANFSGPIIQDLFQVGFDATWEIDIFGGTRRAIRAAFDTWGAFEENARNVQIIVLAEVASTYVIICALQKQKDLAFERIRLDEELLALAAARFFAGLANEQQVQTAQVTFDTDAATLGNLEILLKQTIYSLGVLLGREPETIIGQFQISRPIPYASGKVPTGLPSDLLRRRPDIRAAERQLASATEQIGVAVAALFPQFSLVGSNNSAGNYYGWQSSTLSNLLKPSSRIWTIGPQVFLPLIDFNKRISAVAQQNAIQKQAFITYEKTIVQALQDVESALIAYFTDQQRVQNFIDDVKANQRILALTKDLYQAGLVNYDQVLQNWETLLTAEDTLAKAEGALTIDLVALYKAIGGDWACIYTP